MVLPILSFLEGNNRTDNQHGTGGYLDDSTVAERIYDAMVGE